MSQTAYTKSEIEVMIKQLDREGLDNLEAILEMEFDQWGVLQYHKFIKAINWRRGEISFLERKERGEL